MGQFVLTTVNVTAARADLDATIERTLKDFRDDRLCCAIVSVAIAQEGRVELHTHTGGIMELTELMAVQTLYNLSLIKKIPMRRRVAYWLFHFLFGPKEARKV